MNTSLYFSATHPPDTEDQQVLHLPTLDALRKLPLASRLSLRLGLWLLQRAQHSNYEPRPFLDMNDALLLGERNQRADTTTALLAFRMHQQPH